MDFTSSVKSNLSESFKRIMDVTTSTHLKQLAQKYSYLEEWSIKETKAALLELQSLLLNPEDTVIVAHSFPELVPILLSMPSNAPHARKCVTIAKLLDIHPDVFAYALKYFEKSPAPWEDHLRLSQTEGVPKKKRKETKVTDVEIAETCLRFLRTSANHFKTLWKWSEFARVYLQHKDDRVKRLACHCMAIVTGMDESQLRQMTSRFCQFPEQGHECDPLLPPAPPPECVVVKKKCLDIPFIEKICPSVVSVAGITLPVYNSAKKTEGSLVQVESTLNNLRRAALGVASGRAVCLMGPVGCGKTATVEHLSQITGRPEPPGLLKVQLGDETDAKMLLGAYCCTDVPGEFIWQPGVLTKAVSGGHWLLLEDIDSATSDVIAVLASLLETGAVNVPGYRDNLRAVPGFQLFFTYRLMSGASGTYKQRSNVCELLEKHWVQVNMEPLTREELQHIVQVKFPVLKTVAARMVNLYLKFSAGEHEGLGSNCTTGRLTSTRDLIKWCTRAVVGFDVSSPDSALKVLQDAIDIFCCNINNPESRVLLAKSVSANLGIVQTKAEFFLSSYKPQPIKVINNSCVVGRASLPVKEKTTFERRCDVKFAQTRPSACLLERVSVCLSLAEPVLLVGETGTGKTSTLQLLAHCTGHELVVLNMNQQSDSADLLGGFKPVDVKFIIAPIRNEFEKLFRSYFKVDPNIKFLEHVSNCFTGKKWNQLLQLMKHSHSAAIKRLTADIGRSADEKKQLLSQWRALGEKIYRLETQLKQNQAMLAFTFVEGTLVRALKEGWWVLLDEINLASAETLQCLAGLLEGGALVEGGDSPRRPHPAFRLLAAMNPATDVGKRDLPPGIRNRFTELYVDELTDRTDLVLLVSCYLPELQPARADAVVRFYLDVRAAAQRSLGDAAGHKPHYSLRTLCRALVVAARNSCGNSQRTLHAALCLSFLTQLDAKSHQAVLSMINRAVAEGGDIKGVLGQPIPEPQPVGSHVCFEGYWVEKGQLKPEIPENYILTPCVRRNLQDLSRIVSLSQYPVLVQGDTSVGKTSLITFLASATGNKCVRINNHEHTDLQEYIGSYCADQSGQLVFREGVLVQAMRLGHWIILDELNLAPTDVLEALNRVLDDNRELYIPETQETVRAHPSFRLFATQNPPGLYGGRKMLSRAFRNRFVELHFNEIPGPELETILHQRCAMPTSYCKKLVAVMTELQLHRKGSAAFAGKQGFITLRDLFRWGERYRLANLQQGPGKFYDWDQHIADEGYLVLAGRVRRPEETEVIRQVIRKHIKRSVDPDKLFTLSENTSPVTRHILERVVGGELPPNFRHIVWTFNLRRLAVLVGKACEFKESVLLVGDTGCGKTTVCQLLAALNNQKLFAVNCHQHSESSDFLGALRPVRDRTKQESAGRLFEWVDGPLVEAMRGGGVFLADEISLADDSVLERLNSLLEPERTLLLSEKGAAEEQFVVAQENFRFFGTMNPGGDFGKKELSPALRNRLTEVWCEGVTSREDWLRVVEHNVRPGVSLGNQQDGTSGLAPAIVDFMDWFRQTEAGKRVTVSVRDVLTWVSFINTVTAAPVALDTASAYIHGACLTLVDGLGTGNTSAVVDRAEMVPKLRTACLEFLIQQVEKTSIFQPEIKEMFISEKIPQAVVTETQFGIPPFFIPIGENRATPEGDFTFGARTTSLNTSRLLRALQLPGRAVLLEGSPGVGKTSLVAALARAAGHPLTRINLSDQTDVSDLFGADLPVEGAAGGTFAWRDGPFLRALRLGHWILLDELNLASQSVLEGLNAVLDHRGELFIPELGRSFTIESTKTRMFACQNPLRQGGARRGLPQSFLNRFTQVYMEPLTATDLTFITTSLFPQLPATLVEGMVRFTLRLAQECGAEWAQRGAPWEMNLRDVTRWAEAMARDTRPRPERYVQLVYADRMRTAADKRKVLEVYTEELGGVYPLSSEEPGLTVTPGEVVIGDIVLPRERGAEAEVNLVDTTSQHLVLRSQLGALRSLAACVDNNWLSIVVGPSGSGKTAAVQTLAQLCGRKLQTLSVNSAMDTTEILGGFEQVHI